VTGTVLWIDPTHDVFVILLSNTARTDEEDIAFRDVRRRVSDQTLSILRSPRHE
jgi:CubicO group peptidase (beta-lactamase class C family)